jgi:hypothetical protein
MAAKGFQSVPNKDLQACRTFPTNSALKLQSERKLGLRSPGENECSNRVGPRKFRHILMQSKQFADTDQQQSTTQNHS